MTAEMDVHGDIPDLKEKCTLDMSTYEDLPQAYNAEPRDYVTATPKDDTDGSYVFVTSTDAATNDDHVGSDLIGKIICAQNADADIMEIKVEVPTESRIVDATNPESCLVDVNVSDALEGSQLQVQQVEESDAVHDDIRVADVLHSFDSEVHKSELGVDSFQKVDATPVLEDHDVSAIDDSFDTEANRGQDFKVVSHLKAESIQILEGNQIIAVSDPSNTDANRGEEIDVESSQMGDENRIDEDNGIATETNHGVEVEAESCKKAADIQCPKETGTVAIVKFSDTEANPEVEKEVESSQKAENIQVHDMKQIVEIIKSSNTGANHGIEIEVESSLEVEDVEIQGQNEVVAAAESSSIMGKCGEGIEEKSSQNVEGTQISEDNVTGATSELSDNINNCSKKIEVTSFERVEVIQESQDANLEAAACNCVNGREKIDEIENKSELRHFVEEIREPQITSMSSAKSELDQPDNLVEDSKGECNLGLSLNVENSERTQVTVSEDGENNWSVGGEQAGSIDEVPILESSGDNKLDMDQNLASAPSPPVYLKLETENMNGPIPIRNEDGLPTIIYQYGLLDTNDSKDTVANNISIDDDTKASPASVNCEIAVIKTYKASPSELVSDSKIELNEFTMGEPNHVLELEESSEIASRPMVDKCVKVEVLGATVSENGDDLPISQDESEISDANDSVFVSQSIPEGNEPLESIHTAVAAVMTGNAPGELRASFSTVHKPDALVEDFTKSENVPLPVDDVQPHKQVCENHEICILGNNDVETKFENCNAENNHQSTFPSKNVISESTLCSSMGCEEKDFTAPELSNGDIESSASPQKSVDIDSELHDDESISVPCPAAKKESGDDVEITSSVGSRDMPGDDCIASESEVLKHSLLNNEGDLNTMPDAAVTKTESPTKEQTEAIHESFQDEPSSISLEGSAVDALEGQNVGDEVGTRPFYFLIRVPRHDDDNIKEQIKCAQSEVDKKTQNRDAIRVQIQTMRATWKVFSDNVEAAVSEERAARELLKLKRQEIDSVQSLMTKVKNALSVEDIDGRIRNIEHMIEHETLPLKEEKQLIREIKQLKQSREQLSLTMGKQDELQRALDQREQIEERLKLLRKEVDLLRDNVLKTESVTKAARKKYIDENIKLDELQSQFKAADKIRQEAYADLQGMRKKLYEKNKFFWKYRDDVKEANDLASRGDRERLQHLCVNQVESMMELWNTNDEFRKDYIRCNMRSTLRRLRTLDGRSLGPNEEPPTLTNIAKERSARDNPLSMVSLSTQERENIVPAETVKVNDKPVIKMVDTKKPTKKNKKPDIVALVDSQTKSSGEDEVEEAREVNIKRTKEEEELAAKAEELRKEEEATKLKEQRKLEERTKAKEALERKKRNAERAQAKAVIKARKEAEEREKQREKRAKKKERKMAAVGEAGNGLCEKESAEINETTPTEAPKESECTFKEVTSTRRSQKLLPYSKQSKAKFMPPPLLNRGKRRMQPWMWVLLTTLVAFILFFVGQQWLLY